MKNSFKIAIFYIVLIGILIVATASLWNSVPTDSLLYSQVVDLFKNEQVREFKVDEDNTLTMNVRVTNKDGTEGEATLTYQLSDIDMFREDLGELIEAQHEAGIITAYYYRCDCALYRDVDLRHESGERRQGLQDQFCGQSQGKAHHRRYRTCLFQGCCGRG